MPASPSARTCDILVIGGGVVGLAVAREASQRNPARQILVIEKEADIALHASGRNSGVLHAGFYYTANSLKARLTRDGNREWHAWCREKKLRLHPAGKLVVARDEAEDQTLEELKRRGDHNGVTLEWVDDAQAHRIEPNVRTWRRALWSPSTSTVDPREVCRSLADELIGRGVQILTNCQWLGREGQTILTSQGPIEAGHVFNCAGLYADRVARAFGFGLNYIILPFKGIYLKHTGATPPVRTNVYPVPNLANPFLGVHFTVMVDGHAKIGPTAIPALWRENYRGFENFSLAEFLQVGWSEARLFATNTMGFRTLAVEEMRKYNRAHFLSLAAGLVQRLEPREFTQPSAPGIRAQLFEPRTGKLVQDFVIEGDARSTHVLNAVSPAFTCALPMARHVLDRAAAAT